MGFSVFALGGAGAIGSECCRALLAAPDLDRITIAESDNDRAVQLASQLADHRVQVVMVDARDTEATARAVRGHDVVMNCLFWDHFDDALAVACLAQANYADLLSHPTQAQRERAEAAGITAVSGLGASPGIGNVLGRKACEIFDTPISLEIACTSFRSIAPSPGLLDTLIELASPGLPERGYYFEGRFIATEPAEGSRLIDFGTPVGRVMVYYINHSEVTSFPRHFPTLHYVAVRGSYRPTLVHHMQVLANYGLLDARHALVQGSQINVRQFVRDRIWESCGGLDDYDSHHLFLYVEAAGTAGGRSGRAIYRARHPIEWGAAAIPRMTGIGAAVGVAIIGRQGRTKIGICDPEQYFDPDPFLDALSSYRGLTLDENVIWD